MRKRCIRLLFFCGLLALAAACKKGDTIDPNNQNCSASRIVGQTPDSAYTNRSISYDPINRVRYLENFTEAGQLHQFQTVGYLDQNTHIQVATYNADHTNYDSNDIEFDNQGLVSGSMRQLYNPQGTFTFIGYMLYEYNASRQLIRTLTFNVNDYFLYEYDDRGNVSRLSYYSPPVLGTSALVYSIEYTYDNNPSPFRALSPKIWFTPEVISPNNLTSRTRKDAQGNIIPEGSILYNYAYNLAGFPTTVTWTTLQDPATSYSYRYEYHCW